MKAILVIHPIEQETIYEKVEQNLYWYDTIKKEMQAFKGGQLQYEYKEDEYLVEMGEEGRKEKGIKSTYRMLPKIVDIETKFNKPKMNKDKLKKWYDDYLNYNNSDSEISGISDENIVFSVPDKEIDDFTHLLSRENFEYSVS